MRVLLIILFLTGTVQLFGQDSEISTSEETTIVKAINIVDNPFMFGDNPLSQLNKLNPKTEIQTFNNRHVETKIDSVFTLTIGDDVFIIFKGGKTENGLLNADLTTTKFKTKHGIQVGMSKNEVIEKLSKYGLKSIPTQLVLQDIEIYQLLMLVFTGDRLTRIKFQGFNNN
jgi:hypothetical protein